MDIVLNEEIARFSNINELEKTLLEIYRYHSKKISKDDSITQINKIIERVKNIKNKNSCIVINLINNKHQVILQKYKNGEIGVYKGSVLKYFY